MHNRRPLRGTVQTGPAPHVLPWQVEWVVGQSFNCYIGRVHDKDAINNDSEFSQSRFSANQQQRISISPHKMSSAMLNRNVTSMERHAHSVPVKTGSSLIYVQSSRGRITNPSSSIDESLGYATWGESIVRSSSHDTYFVLHKIRDDTDSYDMWCLSVLNDSDVQQEDIKIACFKYARGGSASRANLIQLWKSDIAATPKADAPVVDPNLYDHPWKVWDDGNGTTINMTAGSVNNAMPMGSATRETYSIFTFGTTLFVLSCDFSNTPLTAHVSTYSSVPSPNEDTGYVLLASVTKTPSGLQIIQYCKNSLWAERFKCAQQPVEYWFSTT